MGLFSRCVSVFGRGEGMEKQESERARAKKGICWKHICLKSSTDL